MKKWIAILVLQFPCACINAQPTSIGKQFAFKGKIIGQDTGYVYLRYTNASGKYLKDSCNLQKGNFSFMGYINEPVFADFFGKVKIRGTDDPNYTDIVLEPTTIEGQFILSQFKKGIIEGSKANDDYSHFTNRKDSIDKKWAYMFDAISLARLKKDQVRIDSLYDTVMPKYRREIDRLTYQFIDQNPNSYVSAYYLFYQTRKLNIDALKYNYNRLSSLIKESIYGKRIHAFIESAELVAIGQPAPYFTLPAADGKNLSLKDFSGKYVFLDFWASYCIPCREENPYLKSVYTRFKDRGFTILGISLDKLEQKNDWLMAIKKDGLPWPQVWDYNSWGSEVVKLYNLLGAGIPSSFLINPEGLIIAKDLRGVELENKLIELLK